MNKEKGTSVMTAYERSLNHGWNQRNKGTRKNIFTPNLFATLVDNKIVKLASNIEKKRALFRPQIEGITYSIVLIGLPHRSNINVGYFQEFKEIRKWAISS